MSPRIIPFAACLLALATAMPALGQGAAQTQGGGTGNAAPTATQPAATQPAATQPATGQAPAAAAQPNTQQQRMSACNTGAAERKLAGEPRKQFMSDCLSGKVPPSPPPAAASGNSQQDKMKTCNAEASAKKLSGDARKTFMSTCLRG